MHDEVKTGYLPTVTLKIILKRNNLFSPENIDKVISSAGKKAKFLSTEKFWLRIRHSASFLRINEKMRSNEKIANKKSIKAERNKRKMVTLTGSKSNGWDFRDKSYTKCFTMKRQMRMLNSIFN